MQAVKSAMAGTTRMENAPLELQILWGGALPACIAYCINSMCLAHLSTQCALRTYQWRDNNHKLAHDGSWKCKAQGFASCIGMPAAQHLEYLQAPCLQNNVIHRLLAEIYLLWA